MKQKTLQIFSGNIVDIDALTVIIIITIAIQYEYVCDESLLRYVTRNTDTSVRKVFTQR